MDEKNKDKQTTIHIDKKMYKVSESSLTGSQFRSLADPSITAEYQLKQQVPGGEDVTIEDSQSVELENGMHFFSIPKNINPGR